MKPSRPDLARVFGIGSGWYPEIKGGAEAVFHALYRDLPEQGFEVGGIVPGSSKIEDETVGKMRPFPIAGIPLLRRARAIRQAAAARFAASRPDLVAAHFALYALPILDQIRGLPLVVHFHGPWALESAVEGGSAVSVAVKKAIERIIYRRADRVIVLTETFGNLIQEHYGVRDAILRVVPGGADLDRFSLQPSRPEARAALGWEQGRTIVVAVRRLVRRMGLDRLIEAIGLLREAGHDPLLYLVGSGAARPELEALVAARGLGEAVRFAGFVPDAKLPLAYRAADISVVPSLALEGFGLIVAESLACGTPVMVTPVGGLPEVVTPLSAALVLPGSAPAEIARGLGGVLANSSLLPDAAACREYAVQYFAWKRAAEKTAAVYRELI